MEINLTPEPHAFPTFVPPNAKVLIIGTFPTHIANRSFNFYYSNRNNFFWKIIGDLYNHEWKFNEGIEAEEERKSFAASHQIAFTDMLESATRENDLSSDENLSNVKLRNILQILSDHPSIEKLVLTSRVNTQNTISAQKLLIDHLNENNIESFYNKEGTLVKGQFEYQNRLIKIFVPYSTMPRVVRIHGEETVRKMYELSLK